ncbi:hypothetical protein TBLA_0A10370 [Henningerozyma blattae CBS 6284]|uniref:Calcipressin n=1 Tax=Henningerozyma blattae (strain ATCC 34711 / CBS 6284 / DSM 70876 / NBRC 10599 / NRRL Y-10934 / UCD 77-7) TaxID=1071380 RepID=I2GXG3_HENB6|nr:hypothetical protein TBLA_0A10370 [Tetrapisispora blattae CBS 6284]CCH58815.1 hypothetical protein TBLA_0A10370 [Tetrapisispora blattae CBS 6284]
MAKITDTIIITSSQSETSITDVAIVDYIESWIEDNVLTHYKVVSSNPVELVALRSFKRVLVICPTIELSEIIMEKMNSIQNNPLLSNLQLNYAAFDSKDLHNDDYEKKYLKLPKGEKRFLVSPPTSPPPEFDYSKVEEAPNVFHHKTPLMFNEVQGRATLVKSSVGTIILDNSACSSLQTLEEPSIREFKTAMPPKSIFEED